MTVTVGRYGVEIQLSELIDPYTFCKAWANDLDGALEEAYKEFGDPKTGLMAIITHCGEVAYSDGVDPNTGKNYDPRVIEYIRSVCKDVKVNS